jgi:23S rRNA (pseudouridine1915-N3)-methyltransferase
VRIRLIVRGRIGRDPEGDIVDRYLKRLQWDCSVTELPDRGGAGMPPREGHARTVLLDERGEMLDSPAFAQRIARWREEGVRELRFGIGAADGFTPEERGQADMLLSLGRMTWPHMMARAMLAEQLWRASAILAGHPYHRAGQD